MKTIIAQKHRAKITKPFTHCIEKVSSAYDVLETRLQFRLKLNRRDPRSIF